MKKYKYKVGELVYFICKSYDSFNYAKELIVTDRIIKDCDVFYKCRKIEKEWYKDELRLNKPIINKLDLFTLDGGTLIMDNLPLNFEYIPEKYLFKLNTLEESIPQCGNNGCEIINNFLNGSLQETNEVRHMLLHEIFLAKREANELRFAIQCKKDRLKEVEELLEELNNILITDFNE